MKVQRHVILISFSQGSVQGEGSQRQNDRHSHDRTSNTHPAETLYTYHTPGNAGGSLAGSFCTICNASCQLVTSSARDRNSMSNVFLPGHICHPFPMRAGTSQLSCSFFCPRSFHRFRIFPIQWPTWIRQGRSIQVWQILPQTALPC